MTPTTRLPASAVLLADTLKTNRVAWRVDWADREAFCEAIFSALGGFPHPDTAKEGLYATEVGIQYDRPPTIDRHGFPKWERVVCTVTFGARKRGNTR